MAICLGKYQSYDTVKQGRQCGDRGLNKKKPRKRGRSATD
jgi:hypothetical protein